MNAQAEMIDVSSEEVTDILGNLVDSPERSEGTSRREAKRAKRASLGGEAADKVEAKLNRIKSRKARLNSITDAFTNAYHASGRRVKRALTYRNVELVAKAFFTVLFYVACFCVGFFVGAWLWNVSVWLYTAFLAIMAFWAIRNLTAAMR